ncbi:MAG: hypothetical protein R3B13_35560 [Polyangiaceae bacterium]
MSDPELLREIETLVAEDVARFGMAGEVRIEGRNILLDGHGPTTRADLGALLEQWDALPQDARRRRATALARRLVEARRSLAPPAPTRSRFGVPKFVAPLLILGAGAGAIWLSYRALTPGGQPAPAAAPAAAPSASAGGADQYEAERLSRAEAVCVATRERVQRGATVGPTDVEGWVVELTLLRSSGSTALTFDPALSSFITRRAGSLEGTFSWAGAPSIAARQGPFTRVTVADASIPDPGHPTWYGVTLTFSGRYVISYFTEEERAEYLKLAFNLADRLGADYAGLYARCAQSRTHHIGAWFRGPDAAGAAASLIYFMGAFADPPHIESGMLFPRGGDDPVRSNALTRIADKSASLTRNKVLSLLSTSGGMISGRTKAPNVISFPFKDGNRASRASLDLARDVDLAVKN